MRLHALRGATTVHANEADAILGASSGRWGTRLAQAALRQTLCATEALVLPKPALYIADAARLFDAECRLIDEITSKALDRLNRSMPTLPW